MSEAVCGEFQMESQVFGLLQSAAAAQLVLESQITGGALAAAAVKLHHKLFQLLQETH
jgi:hypothetical protein